MSHFALKKSWVTLSALSCITALAGCTSARQSTVTIAMPKIQSFAARMAPTQAFSTGLSAPSSFDGFNCIALSISGPGIALDKRASAFCGVTSIGAMGGMAPFSVGSISMPVSSGKNRVVQLLGVVTADGTCPTLDALSPVGPVQSTPLFYAIGQTTTDVLSDVQLSIQGKFDPLKPQQVLSRCDQVALPPTISSVSPSAGPLAGNQWITISGTGFASGITADVNGSQCASLTVLNATTLKCLTPALAAGTYAIHLTDQAGHTASLASAFTYQAVPTVTSLAVVAGPLAGGGSVTVTGTLFLSGAIASIGGTNCTTTTYVSSTSLICVLPAMAASVYGLSVTNTDGHVGTLVNAYTYQAAPTLTSVTQNFGPLAGGQWITLSGTGFISGITAKINGVACTTSTLITSTSMICVAPAQGAGVYSVSVTNTDGQSGSLASSYTYQGPPTISSVSLNFGPLAGGQTITINGTNFKAGITAHIGAATCMSPTYLSATAMTCVTQGWSAGTRAVSVTNLDAQTATLAAAYTYQVAPTLGSLSPTAGPLGGGQTITLTGSGFVSGIVAKINGTNCSTSTYLSASTMTCVTPGQGAGIYTVMVTNTDSQSGSMASAYTYQGPPTVTSVSPNTGPSTGLMPILIQGTLIAPGATAMVNGVPCTAPVVVSSTQLSCLIPAQSGGPFAVQVTNSDSQNGSLSAAFTYATAAATRTFAYVANGAGANTVSMYAVDPGTGVFSALTPATIAAGTMPSAIVAEPSGRFVYVGNYTSNDISMYSINPALGTLKSLGGALPAGTNPNSVAADPTGRFLYVGMKGTTSIYSYSINSTTGLLTYVNWVSGASVDSLSVDPTGQYLYAAGSLPFNINQVTGALTANGSVNAVVGPYAVAVDPSGRFVYSTSLNTLNWQTINPGTGGLNTGGSISVTARNSVAVDHTGRFVFVDNNSTLYFYLINQSTGALTAIGNIGAFGNAGPISVDPSGRFAYALGAAGALSQYSINANTGALAALAPSYIVVVGAAYGLAITGGPSRFAYTANATTNTLSQFAVNPANGLLGSIGSDVGSGIYSVTTDPSGRYAYATKGGGADKVAGFRMNTNTGALTTVGADVTTGSGVSAVSVDPTGRFAYTANTTAGKVSMFSITQATGVLTSIGADVSAGTGCQALAADPTGRFLYTANGTANTVSGFTISSSTGALASIGADVAAGSNPKSLRVDARGQFLYVANAADNSVSMFSINATTGALNSIAAAIGTGTGPFSLMADPTSRFVYTSNTTANTLSMLQENSSSTGILTSIAADVSTSFGPGASAVDPTGRFVYVGGSGGTISRFSINAATGSLSAMPASPMTVSNNPLGIAISQ